MIGSTHMGFTIIGMVPRDSDLTDILNGDAAVFLAAGVNRDTGKAVLWRVYCPAGPMSDWSGRFATFYAGRYFDSVHRDLNVANALSAMAHDAGVVAYHNILNRKGEGNDQ